MNVLNMMNMNRGSCDIFLAADGGRLCSVCKLLLPFVWLGLARHALAWGWNKARGRWHDQQCLNGFANYAMVFIHCHGCATIAVPHAAVATW
jgi:hypothetical protein